MVTWSFCQFKASGFPKVAKEWEALPVFPHQRYHNKPESFWMLSEASELPVIPLMNIHIHCIQCVNYDGGDWKKIHFTVYSCGYVVDRNWFEWIACVFFTGAVWPAYVNTGECTQKWLHFLMIVTSASWWCAVLCWLQQVTGQLCSGCRW